MRRLIQDPIETPTSYLDLYGLSKPPFSELPDADVFILFAGHRRLFGRLVDHMTIGHGVIVLRGEAGSGKTLMLAAAAQSAAETGCRIIKIQKPSEGQLTRDQLLAAVVNTGSYADVQDAINALLLAPRTVLVVDDVDLLTKDARSALIFLLAQVNQKIAVVLASTATPQPLPSRPDQTEIQLPVLSGAEIQQYIERKLWIAGSATRRLISPAALRSIIALSQGLPGRADQVMEAALMAGFARGDTTITHRTVRSAVADSPTRVRGARSEWFARAMHVIALTLLLAGAAAFLYRGLTGPGLIRQQQPASPPQATGP